jgi:hypothetical protein
VQQRQSLLERKAEILGRRSKELELLKMDSLEGLINKALAEKEKYDALFFKIYLFFFFFSFF